MSYGGKCNIATSQIDKHKHNSKVFNNSITNESTANTQHQCKKHQNNSDGNCTISTSQSSDVNNGIVTGKNCIETHDTCNTQGYQVAVKAHGGETKSGHAFQEDWIDEVVELDWQNNWIDCESDQEKDEANMQHVEETQEMHEADEQSKTQCVKAHQSLSMGTSNRTRVGYNNQGGSPQNHEMIQLAWKVMDSGKHNSADDGLKIQMKSKWNCDLLDALLIDYNDKVVVKHLRYGWPANRCLNAPDPVRSEINHKGATQYAQHIDQYIQKEIVKGRMA